MKITTQKIQSSVGILRKKHKINIQKQGNRRRKETLEYFYDPEFPIIGAPSVTEQKEIDEGDALFEELTKKEEFLAPVINSNKSVAEQDNRGLDSLITRCRHLVLAVENCSSDTIQDIFNLDEEQARILMNKVVTKFNDLAVSFCINVVKNK